MRLLRVWVPAHDLSHWSPCRVYQISVTIWHPETRAITPLVTQTPTRGWGVSFCLCPSSGSLTNHSISIEILVYVAKYRGPIYSWLKGNWLKLPLPWNIHAFFLISPFSHKPCSSTLCPAIKLKCHGKTFFLFKLDISDLRRGSIFPTSQVEVWSQFSVVIRISS